MLVYFYECHSISFSARKPSLSIVCKLQGIELYPGSNLQTQTPILSSQLGLGMPAPLRKLGLNRPTGQSESSFNRLSFELLDFQISLAPLEENSPGLCHN